MYFPGSSQSSALYHTPVKPSKKSTRSADEMIENERRQPSAKAFLRLNSLEEDESESKMPITETPKRRPHYNKQQARSYYHRSYHLHSYYQQQPTPHNPWWWHQAGQLQQFQAFHTSPLLSHYQLTQQVPYSNKGQYWTTATGSQTTAAGPSQAAQQQQQPTERGFHLVNNFLPELSFADHAAMAAAAMESTVDHPPPPPVSYAPSLISSQISKTFASIVGGVCNWVAGTLEARLGGAGAAALTTTTTLNPNAKSFVPLNPHAKEFHPKGTAESEPKTPETPETPTKPDKSREPEMKPAGERRGTPWVAQPHEDEDSEDEDFDSPIAAYVSSEEEDSDEDEEEEDEVSPTRMRQVSVGSDDSDYIVFGISDECPEPRAEAGAGRQSNLPHCQADQERIEQNCDNKLSVQDFLVSPADAADTEDEVDKSASLCEDVLSAFQAHLTLDKLSPCHLMVATSTPDDDTRIRAANRSWNDHYDSPPPALLPRSASKVCFAPSDTVIYEDPELAAELAASRQSDFPQRQADKERMERLIGPILTETHRDKVRNRLLGLSL